MKIFLWYLFVVVAAVFLILSLVYRSIYIALPGFIIALILNKYIDDIPLPKQFEKMRNNNKK